MNQRMLSSLSRVERVSPALAANLVFSRWSTPGRPRAARREASFVMQDATYERVSLGRHTIATYRWGSGPNVILLAHGWEGRAADFAPIVRELRSNARTIIALDAPGHGRSSGKRTTVPEYGAVLAELARQHGHLAAVVSHSFGTPAVASATREGLTADRFVSISGVALLHNLVATYCTALGLSDNTAARMRTIAERRAFHGDRTIWDRLSAPASPLPVNSPLLVVHDRSDKLVSFEESSVLAEAHGAKTEFLATEGLGHSRILAADEVLDAVCDFLANQTADHSRQPVLA